jgi:hypothetical protein
MQANQPILYTTKYKMPTPHREHGLQKLPSFIQNPTVTQNSLVSIEFLSAQKNTTAPIQQNFLQKDSL